jgi:hypothetical protein
MKEEANKDKSNLGGKREGSGRKSLISQGIYKDIYRIYLTDDEHIKVKEFIKKINKTES